MTPCCNLCNLVPLLLTFPPTQIDRELRALRSRRCSFELPRGGDSADGQGQQGGGAGEGRSLLEKSDNRGGNGARSGSSGGSGVDDNGSVGGWQRDPSLPSWNRSVFAACIAITVWCQLVALHPSYSFVADRYGLSYRCASST